MSETHDHAEKDSFEPLKQEYYEGKHLSAPVKEIEVNKIISIFLSLSLSLYIFIFFLLLLRINGSYYQLF